MRYRILASLLLVIASAVVHAEDWPRWLGPNADGSSKETGLNLKWGEAGPKKLWEAEGGEGYSTIAVAGGKAITLVQRGGKEFAVALDAKTGSPLWQTPIGPGYKNSYGNGPRSTPSIDGDLVFVQSVNGNLACLKAKDGTFVWDKNLLTTFGGKNISWGLSASPIVDGDLVFAIPGGKDTGVAAFEKKTGKLVWKVGDDKAGYASPVVTTVGGKKQVVFFTAPGLVAVDPANGKELWRVSWKTEFDCNICTPIAIGEKLFVSSGEGVGCAMLHLKADSPPDVLWESRGKKGVMTNYWANAVVQGKYLYGLSGEFDKRIDLNCVDAETGKLMWSQAGMGKGALLLAQDHLIFTTKKGDLVVAKADPASYQEVSRAAVLGENRTSPTLSNRRLYVRDLKKIICFDLE
jgi:outer membrane protein assembly factor BamB